MGRTLPTARLAGLAAVTALAVAACTTAGPTTGPTGTTASTASPTSSGSSTSSTSPASPTSTASTTSAPAGTAGTCAARLASTLTPAQEVGQLLMVGLLSGSGPRSLDSAIASLHLGGVVYLDGWYGSGTVAAASRHVQAQAQASGSPGIGLLVAADQEGGQILQLRPPGFTPVPSALALGAQGPAATTAAATTVGRELAAAGVGVDLAPVADTVPAQLGRGNGPIGRYDRQYGSDPGTVATEVRAAVTGLRSAGVVATVKHFPGLGRVTADTDTSSAGTTDTTTTSTDADLAPFVAGVQAGAQLVMVSSATYARIDGSQPAVFSPAVVRDLLRGRLGYGGVVVTDDLGVAAAVASVPAGDRAVRAVDAGADVVLSKTVDAASAMGAALLARRAADPAFAAKVDASVARVLALKESMGLLRCG